MIKDPGLFDQTKVHERFSGHQDDINALPRACVIAVIDNESVDPLEIFLEQCARRTWKLINYIFVIRVAQLLYGYGNTQDSQSNNCRIL
jgi:hypothetical protein